MLNPKVVIEGPVHVHDVGVGIGREFLSVVLPFAAFREAFRAYQYAGGSDTIGWSRVVAKAHQKRILKAMADGTYVPSAFHAQLSARHFKAAKFEYAVPGDRSTRKSMWLEVNPADPVYLTDGQARAAALLELHADAYRDGDTELLKLIEACPVPVLVHVVGDEKEDHVRLQMSTKVDPTHVHALAIEKERVRAAVKYDAKKAAKAAKLLHERTASVLHTNVKLGGASAAFAKFSVKDLVGVAPGALGTSFVGLVRCLPQLGHRQSDAPGLAADVFDSVVSALRTDAPELLGSAMPLETGADMNVSNASMLVGVATVMAYRLRVKRPPVTEQKFFDELRSLKTEDREALKEAATAVFGDKHPEKLTVKEKAARLRDFAIHVLADCEGERHDGVLRGLVEVLSHTALAVPKLPAKPKRPSRSERVAAAELAA